MTLPLVLIAVAVFGVVVFIGLYVSTAGSKFMQRYRESFMEQARVNLADMFLFIDPTQLFTANILLLIVLPVLVWLFTGSILLVAGCAVIAAILPKRVYRWLRERRRMKIQAQLPDALMMLAGTMRAGLGFRPALESLVQDGQPPLAQELALVLREQHMGVSPEDALTNLSKRVPIIEVEFFVSAVTIAQEVGGNLADSLKTLGETLRRRLIMEQKVKSLTAQGKLQGIIMALLPFALVAYLAYLYPNTMEPMFNTWLGYTIIGVSLLLVYLGYKTCVKIMTIDI